MDQKLQNASKIPNFKSKIALPIALNKANNTTKPLQSPQKTSIPSASIKTSDKIKCDLKENEIHRVKSKLYKFIKIYIKNLKFIYISNLFLCN